MVKVSTSGRGRRFLLSWAGRAWTREDDNDIVDRVVGWIPIVTAASLGRGVASWGTSSGRRFEDVGTAVVALGVRTTVA